MAQARGRSRAGPRQETGVEPPPAPATGQDDAFEPPPGENGEEQERLAVEAVDADLQAMKEAVEQVLFSRADGALKTCAEGEAPEGADNIVGVGIGPAMRALRQRLRAFPLRATPVTAMVGMIVGRTGRTTQLTTWRVIDVTASLRVNFGFGKLAKFRDQVSIRGLNADFGKPGDSGSLIRTWDSRRAPVGLLFAGGGGIPFGNRTARVPSAFDVSLLS